ncbi:endonuclease/exonuclease/phosphatase family protein [Mycolicibacterium sp.]|uniref:endonuclease/exonuclease/phosphatase family protein n=1 Tax=Mycolicibacterium sp. TaxID=2320850 RepID=UPI003D0C3B70
MSRGAGSLIACDDFSGGVLGEDTPISSGRHRRPVGRVRIWLAVLALAYATFTLILRQLPLSNNIALIVAVGSPYVAVVAVLALVLAVLERQVLVSVVAVAIVAVNVAIQVPWYYFGRPAELGADVEIRVLSSNLRKGRADVPRFVALARANADVITLSELTPDWIRRFYATGIQSEFPYSMLVPAPGAGGFGMWSRYPLEVISPLKGGSMIASRVDVPGVRSNPIVASVHIMNALTYYGRAFEEWRQGITAAKERMNALVEVAGSGSVIVVGDFNSTPDMRQFRDLLSNGYRDAVQETGAGFAPTFPSWPVIPPLITIDHLLTRNAAVLSIRTITIAGSDHRSLLATVGVPADKPAS